MFGCLLFSNRPRSITAERTDAGPLHKSSQSLGQSSQFSAPRSWAVLSKVVHVAAVPHKRHDARHHAPAMAPAAHKYRVHPEPPETE